MYFLFWPHAGIFSYPKAKLNYIVLKVMSFKAVQLPSEIDFKALSVDGIMLPLSSHPVWS